MGHRRGRARGRVGYDLLPEGLAALARGDRPALLALNLPEPLFGRLASALRAEGYRLRLLGWGRAGGLWRVLPPAGGSAP